MASPIYHWYTKEVFYWRSLAATLWSIISLPILVFWMSLFLSISLTSPLSWVSDAAAAVFSVHFVFTLMTFTLAVVSVTWFSLSYITVTPDIIPSRLSCVMGLFRWSRLPLMVICVLMGSLTAWTGMGLAQSTLTDFVSTEEYEKTVLNESCLFVICCGMFTGLCYYCQFFARQEFYLSFPSIQRQKVFQVRSETRTMVERTAWQTLHVIKYHYILYFLFGSVPRGWICQSFGICEDTKSFPLDSIVGLMSLSLLWKAYLTSFALTFALSFTLALIRIFHSEQLELPVTSLLEDWRERTLSDALVCSYSPLLQHLAFYDMACLSKVVSPRLQELLSLSQPGGHPKVWMSVSQSAVSAIQELTNQVNEENWSILSKVPISHHHSHARNGGVANGGSSGDRWDGALTYRGEGGGAGVPDLVQTPGVETARPGIMTQLSHRLCSLPLLSHLVTPSQDTSSRRLFTSCQKQIWAVESLSHIAVRAYTEDRYGVVQTFLPDMITAVLDLHEAVEKHFKLSTSPRRPNNGCVQASTPADGLIRYKLQSVLKSSLYQMTNTYKSHLQDIKLRPEEIKKLTPFIHYTL